MVVKKKQREKNLNILDFNMSKINQGNLNSVFFSSLALILRTYAFLMFKSQAVIIF